MRELNTCKEEIFRRSEQRIKERTAMRKRVRAVCVPACLALAVTAAVLLSRPPQTKPVGSDGTVGEAPTASETIYVEAVVYYREGEAPLSLDEEDTADLYVAIQESYNDGEWCDEPYRGEEECIPEDNLGGGLKEELDGGSGQSYGTAPNSNIAIIFTSGNRDGVARRYTLSGATLTDQTTGESVTLTDKQLQELYALIFKE